MYLVLEPRATPISRPVSRNRSWDTSIYHWRKAYCGSIQQHSEVKRNTPRKSSRPPSTTQSWILIFLRFCTLIDDGKTPNKDYPLSFLVTAPTQSLWNCGPVAWISLALLDSPIDTKLKLSFHSVSSQYGVMNIQILTKIILLPILNLMTSFITSFISIRLDNYHFIKPLGLYNRWWQGNSYSTWLY